VIVGIGIDIVDETRFAQQLIRTPELGQRISRQVDYQLNSHSEFAKCFAVLEALYKALPDNQKREILNYIVFKDITGRPLIQNVNQLERNKKNQIMHVSVSHEKLIIEKNRKKNYSKRLLSQLYPRFW
jgi:holo-[acyl-carrier protein] synthase